MEALSQTEVLARWQRAAGEDPAAGHAWRSPEDLGGYFQRFRPGGEGLDAALVGLRHGDELRRLYAVAGDQTGDLYFVVRRPLVPTDEELSELARRHLALVTHAADALGALELVVPSWKVTIRRRVRAPEIDDDSLDTLAHEMVGDWLRSLEPEPSRALLLGEALYLMACSYDLARYVLWPLYRRAAGLDDPFEPAVELWSAGAALRLPAPGQAEVFVPT